MLRDKWGHAWAIEVKSIRGLHNNGKPADDCVKQVLWPYLEDRSALTDATKVLGFGADRKGLLLYCYDDDVRPLAPLLSMFEALLGDRAVVLQRAEAPFHDLVHHHHQRGVVVAFGLGR